MPEWLSADDPRIGTVWERRDARGRWRMLDCCLDSPLPEERCPARLLVDHCAQPHSAAAVMGDFALLYGQADPTLLMEAARPGRLLIGSPAWQRLAQERLVCRSYQRQHFLLEPQPTLLCRLRQLAQPLPGTRLEPIDQRWFFYCRGQEWAADFCSQFACDSDYARWGRGVFLLRDGQPVSGASSYLVSRTGFTIQVQTRPDCQRRGYAVTAAAALVLAALREGLYPDWDADNAASSALAVRLGYTPQQEYTTLLVEGENRT